MFASFRTLGKDLFELQKTGRGLMLAFIAPPLIAILVGQLSVRPQNLRLLIAGTPHETNIEPIEDLEKVLRELPGIHVIRKPESPSDPLEEARRGQYDLVIVPNELGTEEIAAYTANTDPARVAQLAEFAGTIERTLSMMSANKEDRESIRELENHLKELRDVSIGLEPPPPLTSFENEEPADQARPLTRLAKKIETTLNSMKESQKTAFARELSAIRIIPAQSLHPYYPRARDRSAAFLPMTIALVLCFFPFIIAAPSLVREKESHTIEVLLTAPGMTHNWLFAAKCYLPILVAAFDAVLMLICAEFFYQYYFKSGFPLLVLYMLLATSAATFLGLAISAVVRSTIQATAASALYFVCLLLFSGFFVDLDQSASAVRLIANCLPLATLDQIIKAWMFGSQLPGPTSLSARLLFGQTSIFGIIAWVSYRRVFVNRL